MQTLLRQIDRNVWLRNALNRLSNTLAINRGLPMVVGLGLVILSLITVSIGIPLLVFLSDDVVMGWLFLCIPALLLHLGIIVALVGFMLVTPLGRGYRE